MKSIQCEARIRQDQAKVFEKFSNPSAMESILEDVLRIEQLTEGPVGPGTRWRETRVMYGKEATEEMEITEFHPPDSFTVRCHSCGCAFITTYHFDQAPEGVRVRLIMECRPVGLAAKLMSPFSGMMLKPMLGCLQKDLDEMKAACEAEDAS